MFGIHPEDMEKDMREQGSGIPNMVETLQKLGWRTYQHHDNWFPENICPKEGNHVGWDLGEAYKTATDREKVRKAILILSSELIKDEGYWNGWKANIAVSMHDQYYSKGKSTLRGKELHEVFNEGAERFLRLLTGNTQKNP